MSCMTFRQRSTRCFVLTTEPTTNSWTLSMNSRQRYRSGSTLQIRKQKELSGLNEFRRTKERDINMNDCSNDILNYHADEVTLSPKTRETLRANRNANRDRLKRGLDTNKKPKPDEFIIQGSYAMKTMTQHAN